MSVNMQPAAIGVLGATDGRDALRARVVLELGSSVAIHAIRHFAKRALLNAHVANEAVGGASPDNWASPLHIGRSGRCFGVALKASVTRVRRYFARSVAVAVNVAVAVLDVRGLGLAEGGVAH